MKKQYNSREVYSKKVFSNNDRLIVKFSVPSLVIAETFIGIPFVLSIIAVLKNPYNINLNGWILIIGNLGLVILAFLWFKSYHIEISNGILKYRSPFSKIKQIPLNDIEEAGINIGVIEKKDVNRAFIRLVLLPKSTSQVKGFYINLKVFEKNGVKQLLDILPMKN